MAQILSIKTKLKTGEEVIIRTCLESDAEALRDVVLAYISNGEGQLWSPGEYAPTTDQQRVMIQNMLINPNELLLVADYNGQIIGNIDFHVGKRIRISHSGEFGMSCLPAWRGKGLGKILLKAMLDWAKLNTQIEKINLRVISSNHRAICLYKKFGFKIEGEKVKEIKFQDGTYANDILMTMFIK